MTDPLPLSGVRIIEPGQVWALPYAISPLAAYGAEVIKVESAVRPDSSRGSPQPGSQVGDQPWNNGGMYHEANRNKLGISLDLNTDRGKELFKELVSVSDVVAQNFPPRVMRNFGLDYLELRKIKPDIIVLDSTAYGSSGPWENYIGYGSSLQAVTGLTYLTGYEDSGPVQGGILFNDTLGALNATYAILLALAHRERTGQGQWIDLSQYEAGVAHLGEAFMEYEMNGVAPTRRGNSHPDHAPYGLYPCAGDDGWVSITVTSDAEWANFVRAVGEAWASNRDWETAESRLSQRKSLDEAIGRWTSDKDKHEVMHLLQSGGVACGAVYNTRDIATDAHHADRGFFEISQHPEPVGPRPHSAPLFGLTGVDRPPDRLAPRFGEANRKVFQELLGRTDQEYDELMDQQVISDVPANPGVTQPPDPEGLLRMGFLAERDLEYKSRLGI
ncbi:MAG: CoA transferase [Dehalococcoidia bacterium]|nr:CoA transferase [Dehalococcoidia bacterium]